MGRKDTTFLTHREIGPKCLIGNIIYPTNKVCTKMNCLNLECGTVIQLRTTFC